VRPGFEKAEEAGKIRKQFRMRRIGRHGRENHLKGHVAHRVFIQVGAEPGVIIENGDGGKGMKLAVRPGVEQQLCAKSALKAGNAAFFPPGALFIMPCTRPWCSGKQVQDAA